MREKKIILYGQNAKYTGIVFNVLTSLLDFPDVKVYDGSYNEWLIDNMGELEK